MRTYRSGVYVATFVLAITRLTAGAPALAAQGGSKAASVHVDEARFAPARSLLRGLVGRWRFEIRFAGNFDGAPDASGTRVVEALFDDMHLQWTEELDHSQIRTQGIIGFDARNDRFYGSSVSSAGTGPEFLTGTMDPAEPLVTFSPIAPSPGPGRQLMESFTLSMLDADHFTWAPLDRGWRAVFTRER
jgi:hypothetical protein